MKSLKVLMLAAFLMLLGALFADETADTIENAKTLYKTGKLAEAVNELNYAINQIQQMQMEKYKAVFPAAQLGWQAEEFNAEAAAMAFMGGGISVSRRYTTSTGNDYYEDQKSVNITLVSDSPMLSSLLMMFNNPMFLGANKMVTIQGERAIESKNESGVPNELQFVIANRVMLTVDASNCSKDELYAYANKIDFGKLKSILSN